MVEVWRSIFVIFLLWARCIETIDVVYMAHVLFFMSVVVVDCVLWGMFCCVAAVCLKNSVFFSLGVFESMLCVLCRGM